MSEDEETFEKGDAGSSDCVPTAAGSIKKGGYCMIKGKPCKVIEYSTAKPGKHGSSKATIVGVDIFTDKKYEDSCPTSASVSVPNVIKEEFEVADIDDDDFVSLIMEDGSLKTDLKLPSTEEDRQILLNVWKEHNGTNSVMFTVMTACGTSKIIAGRGKN